MQHQAANYFIYFDKYEVEHIESLKELIKYNEVFKPCDYIVSIILKYRVHCEQIKLIQNQQKLIEPPSTDSTEKNNISNQNYTSLETERNV